MADKETKELIARGMGEDEPGRIVAYRLLVEAEEDTTG